MKAKSTSQKKPRKRAAILRNIPAGYHWGWYSREDPRLHLQVVDEKHKSLKYKVWLERNGKRVFEPVGDIPAKILVALHAELEKNRDVVEDKWARFMIRKRWIEACLEGTSVKLVVYPQTEKRLVYVPLLGEHPYLTEREVKNLKQEDVNLSAEMASIEFWPKLPPEDRHDIELAPLLWSE